MDHSDPIATARRPADLTDADLAEVDAAILLVSSGAARRVALVNLRWPELVASTALAHSQARAVAFRIDGAGGTTALLFGDA